MTSKVEKHKRGWAVVEVERVGHLIMRTVIAVYKTKSEAENHESAPK